MTDSVGLEQMASGYHQWILHGQEIREHIGR